MSKGPYLITYPLDQDGITTSVVWHPLFYGPIEDYIKNPNIKVEQLIDGVFVEIK